MCLNNSKKSRDFDLEQQLLELETNISNGPSNNQTQCDYLEIDNSLTIEHSNGDLNIMQLNIRGIINKQKDLSSLLFECYGPKTTVDLITLSETLLTESNKSLIDLPGYQFQGKTRKTKKGGGVGFLTNDSIDSVLRDDLNIDSKFMEHATMEIKLKNQKLIVGTIYRPPNTNAKSFIKDFTRYVCKLHKIKGADVVIGLDHNLDLLKKDQHPNTQAFLETILENNLVPCITRPTRITNSTTTLIDNILISNKLYCKQQSGILLSDISDHLPCLVKLEQINLKQKEPLVTTKRNLCGDNIQKINMALNKWLTSVNFEAMDVNEGFETLLNHLLDTLDEIAPEKKLCVSTNCVISRPWIMKGLMKCSKKQLKLYRDAIKSKSDLKFRKYIEYRNIYKKIKRKCEINHYQEQCIKFKSNTKRLWEMINNVTRKTRNKKCVINKIKCDNIEVSNSNQIANSLNNYFSSVGKNYARRICKGDHDITHYLNKMTRNDKSVYFYPTD